MNRLAVVGGGSWGTALAIILAPRFPDVRLWVYEADLAERMAAQRVNDVYLPGFRLPENIRVCPALAPVLEGAQVVLGVMPSHLVRRVYAGMLPLLDPGMVFVSATKGIETGSLLRMSQVIEEVVSPSFVPRIAVLSGPTFAREVARGEPTALVIASPDQELAESLQNAFSGPTFRPYRNSDMVGVELGGALKNTIAIGAGICQGMGLGSNASAALITRGLAEITRLAVALGGQPSTLAGLAGLGDLVLTCNGDLSRNRQVGIALGEGRQLPEIVESMHGMVAEGVKTTDAAAALAARCGIDLPIVQEMYRILHDGRSPRDAIRELMVRSLKGE